MNPLDNNHNHSSGRVGPTLSPDEKERYSRHILLREVGISGMEKIRRGRVLVIGAGGLAAPLLTYLTVSGIGKITIVDHDRITAANLGRQFLYREDDIGETKVESATAKLRQLNPGVEIEAVEEMVTKDNFSRLISSSDLVAETVDSTANKILIHDLCLRYRRPLVHASVLALEGQLLTIFPGETPCLKCFFPSLGITPERGTDNNPQLPWVDERRDSCSTEGVLSPLCGVMGSLQAAEVLSFFSRPRESLITNLLHIDYSRGLFRNLHPQIKHCSSCGLHFP